MDENKRTYLDPEPEECNKFVLDVMDHLDREMKVKLIPYSPGDRYLLRNRIIHGLVSFYFNAELRGMSKWVKEQEERYFANQAKERSSEIGNIDEPS